jgi:tRNA threonylcarbamoyladenosine biosynthesis protein TsaB
MILNIDTSTNVCSVALTEGNEVLAHKMILGTNEHASKLTVLIESMLKEKHVVMSELKAVAVSSGPGSYTGLRIGISTAKGICYALSLPLIAVGTLDIIAQGLFSKCPEAMYAVAMIDARRMEVYSQIISRTGEKLTDVEAQIIDASSYSTYLADKELYFCGNGTDKCADIIISPNAKFISEIYPLAQYMASLSDEKYKEGQFEDVAYFEPFYLKEFVATVAKNKIF